jgi:hypothetical protein
MPWTEPAFKKNALDRAGEALRSVELPIDTNEGQEILKVINNWRESHAFPLNSFQNLLRKRAKKYCDDPVIAQRAKRLDSIYRKLVEKPRMRLSQMQDIAGCLRYCERHDAIKCPSQSL